MATRAAAAPDGAGHPGGPGRAPRGVRRPRRDGGPRRGLRPPPAAVAAIPVWGALHALRRRSWRVRCPALAPVRPARAGGPAVGLRGPRRRPGRRRHRLRRRPARRHGGGRAGLAGGRLERPCWRAYAAGRVALRRGRRGAARRPGGMLCIRCAPAALFQRDENETRTRELVFRDAGDMAAAPERRLSLGGADGCSGRGVVALLSAPPGLGKGWWTWGWLRAMQDGGDFFGLRVRRPSRRPGRWPGGSGREPSPLKVLWLTEEGESFGATAKRFGIAPGLVTVLQRRRGADDGLAGDRPAGAPRGVAPRAAPTSSSTRSGPGAPRPSSPTTTPRR